MPDLDNNIFDQQLHDKINDHESDYSAGAWKDMQMKLDNSGKAFPASGSQKAIKTFSLILLMVSVSLLTVYELYRPQKNNSVSEKQISVILPRQSNTKTNNSIKNDHGQIIHQKNFATIERKAIPNEKYFEKSVAYSNQKKSKLNFNHSKLSENPGLTGGSKPGSISENKAHTTELANRSAKGDNINDQAISSKSISGKMQPATDTIAKTTIKDTLNKLKSLPTVAGLKQNSNIVPPPDGIKRGISFGPYLSLNLMNSTNVPGSGSTFYTIDLALGAFVNFPISDRFSIQTSLGYGNVNEGILKTDTVQIMNDVHGKIYRITSLSTGAIGYIQVPILLKYKLNKKFRVLAGARFSYAINNLTAKATIDYKDSLNNYVYVDTYSEELKYNKNNDLNRFSVFIPVGLQWNISPGFDMSLTYSFGLTNVLKTQYHYIETWGSNNLNLIELRIGCKLFSRKFNED